MQASQRMLEVIHEMTECRRFFGVEVYDVEILIREMFRASPRPEWLRNKPGLRDLPRYARFGVKTPHHRFPHPRISLSKMAERVIWVVENNSGPWKVQHTMNPALFFIDVRDAVHYRLRWSGIN